MRIQIDVQVPATFVYDIETDDLEHALNLIKNHQIKPVDKIFDNHGMKLEAGFLIQTNDYNTDYIQTEIDLG